MFCKNIVSVSFGKDSLAMLLKLIDNKERIDEVVFYNTGMEFKAIYNIRDKVLPLLKEHNIKYIELKPRKPFLYTMFEKEVNGRNGKHLGYSWCGGTCRWGTTEKLKELDKYCKDCFVYVGIANDEKRRIARVKNHNSYGKSPMKIMPLVKYEMSEKDCLEYCKSKGFTWEENGVDLYSILDRVSCWCCKNKNLKELNNYYKYLPKYWEKLKELQAKTDRPFKNNMTIFDLEERFKKND